MSDRESIDGLLARYAMAVGNKDVDAFVALYDEEVQVFDMWARWSYDGIDEWRAMAAEWFGSLGDEKVAVEFQDVDKIVGDGVAAAHAVMTIKGLSAEGEELRAMNNRLTWALSKTPDGMWKVVHEHTSAPIDFETSKVMLQK